MKGLLPVWKAALFSILRREQNGRHGTIMFGDDPELYAGFGFVGREQTRTFKQGPFVFEPVVFIKVAPIARVMTAERGLEFAV